MQTPKRLMPKPQKPKNDHIPALNPARLDLTLQALDALPISAAGKRAVAASLKAATNPQAEAPHVVIATLEKDRRERIHAAQKQYAAVFNAPAKRGKAALQNMSDSEWNAMVEEANK